MQTIGRIQSISEPEQVGDNFTKREFVLLLDFNDQYPQPIKFELHNSNCNLIDGYKEGQIILVNFRFRGRQWENKPKQKTETFNTLWVWKITPVKEGK